MITANFVSNQFRVDIARIHPGDLVRVHQKIKEGDKERVSAFEGIIIAKKHGDGITGTFTVRKVVDGIGVERTFPIHSPRIDKIDIVRRSKVRRAKLYYIRDKAAREVRRKMRTLRQETASAPVIAEEQTTEIEETTASDE